MAALLGFADMSVSLKLPNTVAVFLPFTPRKLSRGLAHLLEIKLIGFTTQAVYFGDHIAPGEAWSPWHPLCTKKDRLTPRQSTVAAEPLAVAASRASASRKRNLERIRNCLSP